MTTTEYPPAALYPCARYPCEDRAIVVYQGPTHPAIYGACADHLEWTSDPSRSVLEGATVIHFATQRYGRYEPLDMAPNLR